MSSFGKENEKQIFFSKAIDRYFGKKLGQYSTGDY